MTLRERLWSEMRPWSEIDAAGEEPDVFPPDLVQSGGFAEALRGMVNREFLTSEKHVDQHRRAVRAGAYPAILEFEKVFIRRMAKLGVPFHASEVYRTPDRQNDLHALGHSKAKAGQSPHQFGLAADLIHSVKGWALDERQWKLVGHVGKEAARSCGLLEPERGPRKGRVYIEWGGDWDFYDPAHWQVKGWKALMGEYPWKS